VKKLLFIPLFGALAWLGSCSFHYLIQPTPTEIIQQAHDAFPSAPTLPTITVPTFNPVPTPQPKAPSRQPKTSRGSGASAGSTKNGAAGSTPVPYVAEGEPEVPEAHVECIFPLNLIPGCRPQQ
jgi:hypothetical protein